MRAVVDTNVLQFANQRGGDNAQCAATSATALERLSEGGTLVIDDRRRILEEYLANARSTGEPGAGDAFLAWVLTNMWTGGLCEQVAITDHEERGFAEFPEDPDLVAFDDADRKFVATALAAPECPPIWISLDTDWWEYERPLRDAGVDLEYLCPDLMEQTAERRNLAKR